jgi:hypothetical protein
VAWPGLRPDAGSQLAESPRAAWSIPGSGSSLRSAWTAAIIDSPSVKGSEIIGCARRGYDARKKINGTKRHLAVDVLGLLPSVLVTAASVQDRDAARPLLWNLRRAFPPVKLAWADGGYAGKLVTWAAGKLKPKLTLSTGP